MIPFYIGNTDNTWFDFLKARAPLEEVNFWKPSPQTFKAVPFGAVFAFRLKAPRNVIGGYGILTSSTSIPIRLAWEAFGEANGASSQHEVVAAIDQYRRNETATELTHIGCRVLTQTVFLDEMDWIDTPSDWANSIVSGKTYDASVGEGRRVYEALMAKTDAAMLFRRDARAWAPPGAGERPQPPIAGLPPRGGLTVGIRKVRPGQGTFRINVAHAYRFACAVSDTKVLPALEAAHIQAYGRDGTHETANGLFLRRDIHSVFDAGFATFDEQMRFVVSPQVKTIFDNGNEYRRLHGSPIKAPDDPALRPDSRRMSWHRENVYVGD